MARKPPTQRLEKRLPDDPDDFDDHGFKRPRERRGTSSGREFPDRFLHVERFVRDRQLELFADVELKAVLLAHLPPERPDLQELYKDMVRSGVLTSEALRTTLLDSPLKFHELAAQRSLGDAMSFLASISGVDPLAFESMYWGDPILGLQLWKMAQDRLANSELRRSFALYLFLMVRFQNKNIPSHPEESMTLIAHHLERLYRKGVIRFP